MYPKSVDIASLISSRICHDLASPLGAIANGLELLELSGASRSPEYMLLSDSVENASARINFFRFAFGPPGSGMLVGEADIRSTIDRYYGGGRITVHWLVPGDLPRPQVKLALLMLSCLEGFLPVGGALTVSCSHGIWTFEASDPRLRVDPDGLAPLTGQNGPSVLKPSQVQYELVRRVLSDAKVPVTTTQTDDTLTLTLPYSVS